MRLASKYSSGMKYNVLLIVLVLFGLSLFLVSHVFNDVSEGRAIKTFSPVKPIKHALPRVIVLLQQSPVQPDNQVQRLYNIDKTWATWTQASDASQFDMRLVAAVLNRSETVENSLANQQPSQFNNIDTVPMFPDSKTNIFDKGMSYESYTPSNYHNMLQSFMTLFTSTTIGGDNVEWLVYANDHTFMIPSNLDTFLTTLDASQLIYTGNRLAMPIMNQKVLSFMSGGAGAVLSHTSVKLMLLVWYSLNEHNDEITDRLLEHIPAIRLSKRDAVAGHAARSISGGSSTSEKVRETLKDDHLTMNATNSPATFVEALRRVKAWRLEEPRDRDHPSSTAAASTVQYHEITVVLSSHVSVHMSRSQNDVLHVDQKPSYWRLYKIQVVGKSDVGFSSDMLKTYCTISDKWSHQNPGIELAKCLQFVFNIQSTDHTSPLVYQRPAAALTSSAAKGVRGSSSSTNNQLSTTATQQQAYAYGERFNCYDPLRLLISQTDDWYTSGKKLVYDTFIVPKLYKGGNTFTPPLFKPQPQLALDVISFHYVDTVEMKLLFDVLEHKRRDRKYIVTSEYIKASWPKTQEEAGVYGKILRKSVDTKSGGIDDAELIAHYLTHGMHL